MGGIAPRKNIRRRPSDLPSLRNAMKVIANKKAVANDTEQDVVLKLAPF